MHAIKLQGTPEWSAEALQKHKGKQKQALGVHRQREHTDEAFGRNTANQQII